MSIPEDLFVFHEVASTGEVRIGYWQTPGHGGGDPYTMRWEVRQADENYSRRTYAQVRDGVEPGGAFDSLARPIAFGEERAMRELFTALAVHAFLTPVISS